MVNILYPCIRFKTAYCIFAKSRIILYDYYRRKNVKTRINFQFCLVRLKELCENELSKLITLKNIVEMLEFTFMYMVSINITFFVGKIRLFPLQNNESTGSHRSINCEKKNYIFSLFTVLKFLFFWRLRFTEKSVENAQRKKCNLTYLNFILWR